MPHRIGRRPAPEHPCGGSRHGANSRVLGCRARPDDAGSASRPRSMLENPYAGNRRLIGALDRRDHAGSGAGTLVGRGGRRRRCT